MTTQNTKNKTLSSTAKKFSLALGLMTALGAGLVTSNIISTDTAFAHAKNAEQQAGKHDGKHHGKHGKRAGKRGPSEAEKAERLSRFVERISAKIDATAEQKSKIETLMKTISTEIRPLRREAFNTRGQLKDLLLSETIDKAAIETLRQERLAKFDTATSKVTLAMVDLAEALTLEQRKTFGEKMEGFRKKRWRHK